MNNLRKLVVTLSLLSVLAVTAFAGETQSPPCDPGETHGPPCPSAPITTTGVTEAPPAADSFSVFSVVEDALFDLLIF